MEKVHSVLLDENKCEGCTHCVQNCPTKAIRVHQGQAWIKEEYCIDCGECIRNCEHHAKYAATDELEEIKKYKYAVALVPPSFYGQFTQDIDPAKVMIALKDIGFAQVWDVALGAEAITKATRKYLKEHKEPIISSSCPAVVRLIQVLYPELLEHLAPFKSPVEVVAQRAKDSLVEELGVAKEDVGIFFITPCPAKMTTVNNPIGMDESYLDGAIGVNYIFHKLIKLLDKIDDSRLMDDYKVPYFGISWGSSGGEGSLLEGESTVSASGIHNVISILEELDRGVLSHVRYFELVSCQPGCVGGVFNVKNPFLAQFNIEKLINKGAKFIEQDLSEYDVKLDKAFTAKSIKPLDEDFATAMAKLTKLEGVIDDLPGLDCAACGAPDCKTLAEDIVNGLANESDCIFILRQQLADLADEVSSLARALPPVMQGKEREDDENETK